MFGRFFRTYKHRCPDGSVKTVYRNVDDAFPFFLPGWKAKIEGNVKVPVTAQGGLKGEYEKKIQGLLFGLDDLNQGLMMTFRGAYVAFQTDPCSGYDFLMRAVSDVLREQQRLLKIRLQIDGLISLAKTSKDAAALVPLYKSIVDQVGGPAIADAAVIEIHELAEDAKNWIGGRNVS